MEDPRGVDRRALVLGALSAAGVAGCRIEVQRLDALDPITPIGRFYVYQCCGEPVVDPAAWRLSIRTAGVEVGSVDRSWLRARTPSPVELTLECIGATPSIPNIGNAVWGGLPLRSILDQLGVTVPAGAVDMVLRGADGYHASIPVADLDTPVWLAWRMNDQDLPFAHGAPARLMVPGRYGVKNVKWLVEVDFVDTPVGNYWDPGGWDPDAVVRPNGFIFVPGFNETVTSPFTLLGTAFAGSDPITRVEVTDDGGQTWREASLDYAPGPDIWAIWSLKWRSPPGRFDLQVRVHTEGGQSSTLLPDGSDLLAGFDGGSIVRVRVEG